MVKQSLGSAIFVNEVDANPKAFQRPVFLLRSCRQRGGVDPLWWTGCCAPDSLEPRSWSSHAIRHAGVAEDVLTGLGCGVVVGVP